MYIIGLLIVYIIAAGKGGSNLNDFIYRWIACEYLSWDQ